MPSTRPKKASNKFLPTLEADVQAQVLDYFRAVGYEVLSSSNVDVSSGARGIVVRMPIGSYPFRRANGQVFWGTHPLQGFMDLFGVFRHRPGRMFVIELKSTNGKFRPRQQSWLRVMAAAGVETLVARDVMTVAKWLREKDLAENASHV